MAKCVVILTYTKRILLILTLISVVLYRQICRLLRWQLLVFITHNLMAKLAITYIDTRMIHSSHGNLHAPMGFYQAFMGSAVLRCAALRRVTLTRNLHIPRYTALRCVALRCVCACVRWAASLEPQRVCICLSSHEPHHAGVEPRASSLEPQRICVCLLSHEPQHACGEPWATSVCSVRRSCMLPAKI